MQLPEHVTLLEEGSRKYYLVGTAHVSEDSVREVEEVIDLVKPDTVCVELCDARYHSLTDKERWKNLDIFKVIKEGKTLFLLATLAIGAYQRRLGAKLGIKPGAELMAGAEKAKEVGAALELIDRDIHITLKRTWGNLGFFKKMGLLSAIMGSMFEGKVDEEVGADEIEALKEQANLSLMMEEFSNEFPEVHKPLIDERDRYMISGIKDAPGEIIVAVVGAGHVPGMKRYFDKGEPIDREPLKELPTPKFYWSLVKWVIPTLILVAFYFGITSTEGGSFTSMLTAWILPNAIVALVLTALAGGKVISVLTAAIASPITSLNPLLGAGMVVGLVEAWLRKPTVEDAENINIDVQSFRGLYRNPFTRVLLVAVAATMGSALGAWIGGAWIVALLA